MIFLRPIRSASGPNHRADGLGIEAVEKQHRRAGQQQPDLKSAHRLLIDELRDIDDRRAAFTFRNRHRGPLFLKRPAVLSTVFVVIARSEATKQSRTVLSEFWIASLRSQ